MTKPKPQTGSNQTATCSCCGARCKTGYRIGEVFCSPECSRMFRTGESMDDLVREASQMPTDIPDNNHDYDEFDIEKMMSRKEEE